MIHPRMFSPYKCSYYHPKKDLVKFDHMPKGYGEPITTFVRGTFIFFKEAFSGQIKFKKC
jgi:hypothetical protein